MSDNMQAVELLPCPFCGNTSNDIESRSHDDLARDQAHVFCLICEAYGPITRTEPEAIEAWNRRAATADARAGWATIESAPKDGAPVLLYGICDGEINGKRDAACMCVGQRYGATWIVDEGDCYTVTVDATHWMPLPPPPRTDR